jgi:T-complex protein 1 subunit gamma
MSCAKPFIVRNIHPSIVCSAFYKALEESLNIIKEIAVPLDLNSKKSI